MGEKAAVDPSMAASAATLHAVFILAPERTVLVVAPYQRPP
jgi:hypothetical protein